MLDPSHLRSSTRMRHKTRSLFPRWMMAVWCLVCAGFSLTDRAAGQSSENPGRISGRIVDESSGRGVAQAQVEFVETGRSVLTDLDGRYRSPALDPGTYSIRVSSLGFTPVQVNGISVIAGEVATVNVGLSAQALDVEGLVITAERLESSSSEAGLLAIQQAAVSVSDGISAEQISRSPDSDAGDAIARVTGISVVDDKFVVVRGLGERYSNTLLNGTELASPEPTKRIVPLDIFSARFLESVVATKTATPDKPGNFAGGSVELRTKEFPEDPVLEVSMSGSFNSVSTLEQVPFFLPYGRDWLALDGGGRLPPAEIAPTEGFGETVRNRWTPRPRTAPPDFGFGVDWGGQVGDFERAFGYVLSLDYGSSVRFEPVDSFAFAQQSGTVQIAQQSTHSTTTVDWGGLANASKRLGAGHSVSIKNLFTREAEEFVAEVDGFDNEARSGFLEERKVFQVNYIQRTFVQSQLSGRHLLGPLGNSTIEWKGSVSYAGRDEPENRSLNYLRREEDHGLQVDVSKLNFFWLRFLDDWLYSGQVDWSLPLGLFDDSDSQFSAGVSYRLKDRNFDAEVLEVGPPTSGPPDGVAALSLRPEELMAPENVGRNIVFEDGGSSGLPYGATEILRAAYGMVDVRLLDRLRLVGGLRVEEWDLELFTESSEEADTTRLNRDYLWSGNLTVELTDRMNLRLAGYRTLSRPDPRELAPGFFIPIAGECDQLGNPGLVRTNILNGDVRWEWFPDAGELVSVSGFYKDFDAPVVEAISATQGTCRITPENAKGARNLGLEVELRKNLGFITPMLSSFSVTGNFTYVDGEVEGDGERLPLTLALQDQSPILVNGSLLYQSAGGRVTASALVNHFDDRVTRYGLFFEGSEGERSKSPDVVELGRTTVDAKLSLRVTDSFSMSVAGRNLTNEVAREIQRTDVGPVTVGLARSGRSASVSFSWVIR